MLFAVACRQAGDQIEGMRRAADDSQLLVEQEGLDALRRRRARIFAQREDSRAVNSARRSRNQRETRSQRHGRLRRES
jgi:hypothetical protein